MSAPADQAGPGLGRGRSSPASVEAAGPAGPRLILEEVSSRLGSEEVEVGVTLRLGPDRFLGTVGGRAGEGKMWELAAAASVAAMQQYLQQHASDPATPQVQLLDVGAFTTGVGQEFVAARISISHSSERTDLLGSALVGNDRSRAAVAAALDAVSRYLGRLPAPPAAPAEPCWGNDVFRGTVSDCSSGCLPGEELLEGNSLEEAAEAVQDSATTKVESPARSPAGFPAIGVAVSPTSILVSAVNSGGQMVAHTRRATQAGMSSEAMLSAASQAVREVLEEVNGASDTPTSIGLALPGQVVEREGTWLWSGDLPNWRDVPVAAPFAEDFGLPIAALSTIHAAAFAEFSFGAAQGIADILYLEIGAGIDAALLVRGRPFLVARISPGQAGHMVIDSEGPRCTCGDSGCWQALAGRDALIARVVRALRSGSPSAVSASVDGQLGAITPALVVRMASAGDAVARRALEETGRYFALGLANLIALFGPQVVIVQSQPPPVAAALLRAAERALKSSPRSGLLSHCVLVSPELGESAAVLGAAAWAAYSAS